MHLATVQTGDEPKTEQLSLSEVAPDMLLAVWPQVEPHLIRALSHGQGDETTPQHVLAALLRGESFMWVAHADEEIFGCAVLRVVDHDACRKVWVDFIVGRQMDRWLGLMEKTLADYVDIIGAKCAEGSCRPGLARILERRGNKRKAVIMEFNYERR